MKRGFLVALAVLVAATVVATVVLLKPVGYSACVSLECAMQFDARESESRRMFAERRRVCDAVERFCRGSSRQAKAFCTRHPELCDDVAMFSNALATCQMKVREGTNRDPPIVDVRVSAKNDALACSMADFLADDFCEWLESQSRIEFDKNTAELRVAISKARQSGRVPDSALVDRLASARAAFDQDRLKVRVVERSHVVTVQRAWQRVWSKEVE